MVPEISVSVSHIRVAHVRLPCATSVPHSRPQGKQRHSIRCSPACGAKAGRHHFSLLSGAFSFYYKTGVEQSATRSTMEAPWRHGGRGRARGRGVPLNGDPCPAPGPAPVPARNAPFTSGPWSSSGRGNVSYASVSRPVQSLGVNAETSKKKFEDIQKANQAVVKKLADNYSSSDDEDDADGEEDNEGKQKRILALTFTTYTNQTDGDTTDLARTKQYVNEAFQSGAVTCLICIASVKRNQAVWSCFGCYCIFHMPCIQKWAKDSIFLVSSLTDDDFEKKDYPWPCPKCRYEYKRSQTPARYYCYCGKVEDPPLDPWLVPHSCGQVCEKEFKPSCGHKCLLLCHPGELVNQTCKDNSHCM
ncbi:unnamed protein product [Ranitomeya imitator]|uniref:RING-type domain-containing protein n=1 Tax=Ranitomeya imitator TaxID=111125 RepID=A0ABN9M4A1_9NEOB|nr:unnamed protein product [Ranitomeya imitator]